jgi:hypothetical protein
MIKKESLAGGQSSQAQSWNKGQTALAQPRINFSYGRW